MTVAGKARLRVVVPPRPAGSTSREDLQAEVHGTLELPPWTPPQGAPIAQGTCTLRWRDGDWHLDLRLPVRDGGRLLEVAVAASRGAVGPGIPEPAALTLHIDGTPCAHGELALHLRRFALLAVGEAIPTRAEVPTTWRDRLPLAWLMRPSARLRSACDSERASSRRRAPSSRSGASVSTDWAVSASSDQRRLSRCSRACFSSTW